MAPEGAARKRSEFDGRNDPVRGVGCGRGRDGCGYESERGSGREGGAESETG